MGNALANRLFGWTSCVAFFAFLLPNHYSPWLAAHQEWAMAVAILPLGVWAALRKNTEIPALAAGAWALALVPPIQFICGKISFAGDAWMAALYLSGFGFSVLAGSGFVSRQDRVVPNLSDLANLWLALVLTCIISVGVALHQWLDLQLVGLFIVDLPPKARVYANLAQPNQLATLFLLGLGGIAFLFEDRKVSAPVALVATAMIFFGLAMTESRSALTALCWFWLIYLLMRRRCRLRLSLAVSLALTGFFLLITLSWPAITQLLFLDDAGGGALNRMAPGVRTIYWQSMLDAVSRSPWTGYGWGQIPTAQQAVALAHPASHNFFESAHNLALDLVLWNGLPIGLACSLLLIVWFMDQYRALKSPLGWCLFLAIGFVFNHAMVEFPLYYAYFLLPVGFWMGALSAGRSTFWSFRPRAISAGISRAAVVLCAAGTLLLFSLVSMEYPLFEKDWEVMRFQEKAIGEHDAYVPPKALVLTQLEGILRVNRTPAVPGMSVGQIDELRRVSLRYAYSSVLYRYAVTQGLNGDPGGAQRTLALLCNLHEKPVCRAAEKDWLMLGKTKWPQLASIPFAGTAPPN